MKKAHKLSVYLIKKSVIDFIDSLKEGFAAYGQYPLKQQVGLEGAIIVGQTRKKEAEWKILLQQGTDKRLEELESSSNRAIVFFKIEGRIFAITFGYGKHMLNEDLIERNFGLRTALNLMNSEKLISIDKANLSNLTLLTKTQSSRKSKPEAFDLDIISDLLRGITGGLQNSSDDLGSSITGNEGVYIIPKINFIDIPEKLKKLKKAYESDRYKENFEWIDNLKELKEPTLIETLRESLVSDLKAKNFTKIHIAPPNIIAWDDFEGYAFNSKNDELKTEFDVEDFYEYKGDKIDELDWRKLQASSIYIKYGNLEDRISHPFWRFINYEVELGGDYFVFTLAKWYKINKDYVQEIIDYIKGVDESELDFIPCESKWNERKYNEELAKSKNDYLLFDRNLVKSDLINRSGIEVCDVFSKSKKEFVHVKPRTSSSTLSHLFSQGKISSLALIRDDSFRRNLRTKLSQLGGSRELIPLKRSKFKPNDYTVTFALIDKKDRKFIDALPFFSLLNFRLTMETLTNFGFNVKVKNVKRQ